MIAPGLPDGNGLELIGQVCAANPHCSVLVLSASAVTAGAAAVLHKSAHIDEIISAVRRISAGEQLFAPGETIELLRLRYSSRNKIGMRRWCWRG